MQVDRHASAVITNLDAPVGHDANMNVGGMSREGFINTIVNDFLGQMVRARGVGIHAGSLSDRVKT